MNWSSHEFIWLDWVVLTIGLLGVVAAVWYAIWKGRALVCNRYGHLCCQHWL